MKAQVTLTVAESKRLIGKAVKEHPWVKKALKSGIIAIGTGSTNAYVVEEILGIEIEKKRHIAGFIDEEGACIVPRDERSKSIVLDNGRRVDESLEAVAKRMGRDDVFIKGANALDFDGIAGVMMASLTGGTVGDVIGTLKARGIKLLIPVGLEKLICHSVAEASNIAGIYEMDYSDGVPVGIMPISGEVITEIEAFMILSDVDAVNIGAGGIGSGEGSKTFILHGKEGKVSKALRILESIRGEENIEPLRGKCKDCVYLYCPRNKSKKDK
ncbi:MAG: hypothetical protein V3T58_04410 [Candidatus Hydrothermarchaeales archaeon]